MLKRKNKTSCIYCIENLINNKKYIGSTIDYTSRKSYHLTYLKNNKHDNLYLQNSYNKYKENNFRIYILEKIINIDNLKQKEEEYINYFNTLNRNFGYNIESPIRNNSMSKETKEKISLKLKNRIFTEEHKNKLRIAQRERLKNKEYIIFLSNNKKGSKHHNYGKKGINSPTYKRKHTKNEIIKIKETIYFKNNILPYLVFY